MELCTQDALFLGEGAEVDARSIGRVEDAFVPQSFGQRQVEGTTYSFERHLRATPLAVGRPASDMWCGDEAALEEGLIDDGLTLPAVDDEVGDLAKLQPLQQGGTRGDGATTSIDEERTTRTALEEGLIDHPLGGVLPRARQRYVKCDDIALALDRLE